MEHLKAQALAAVIAKEQLRDSVCDVLQTKLGLNGTGKTKVVIDPNDPFTPPDYGVPEHFDRTETVELYPYYENEYEYGPLMKTKWGQVGLITLKSLKHIRIVRWAVRLRLWHR